MPNDAATKDKPDVRICVDYQIFEDGTSPHSYLIDKLREFARGAHIPLLATAFRAYPGEGGVPGTLPAMTIIDGKHTPLQYRGEKDISDFLREGTAAGREGVAKLLSGLPTPLRR